MLQALRAHASEQACVYLTIDRLVKECQSKITVTKRKISCICPQENKIWRTGRPIFHKGLLYRPLIILEFSEMIGNWWSHISLEKFFLWFLEAWTRNDPGRAGLTKQADLSCVWRDWFGLLREFSKLFSFGFDFNRLQLSSPLFPLRTHKYSPPQTLNGRTYSLLQFVCLKWQALCSSRIHSSFWVCHSWPLYLGR